MSWSFQAIGTPEKVAEALEAYPEKNWPKRPEDFSRKEFEEAQPHLLALVKLNFVEESAAREGYTRNAIRLNASGSASNRDGKKLQSSCAVTIENFYGYVG